MRKIVVFLLLFLIISSSILLIHQALIEQLSNSDNFKMGLEKYYNKEYHYNLSNKKQLLSANNRYPLIKSTKTKHKSSDLDATYIELNDDQGIYYMNYKNAQHMNIDTRYKNYVPFNENVITKSVFYLYNSQDEIVYYFEHSLSLPIIIKETNSYYVEYKDQLFYIKKSDVEKIVTSVNSENNNIEGVQVLAYHFFYKQEERVCNQNICLEVKEFEKQLQYLKENNFFSITMHELEDYIDGKLQLPKNTIVLTIDDGWLAHEGIALLEKYQIHATLFLITGDYDKEEFKTDYLEVHSHGHHLHAPGICPGGQGGPIKCLPHDHLINDLKKSRQELDNTTVFCYPFYEYNDYAINILKEAGFTMAFTGLKGDNLVHVGSNKMELPRYTIRTSLSFEGFKKLVG